MRILNNIIVFFVATVSVCSCNFLDVEDHYRDTLIYDSVFTSTRNVQRYLWSISENFPDEGKILTWPYTPGPLATDEAITTFGAEEHRGIAFSQGLCTPDDPRGLDYAWIEMYKNIRRVNILLSRVDEAPDMTVSAKNEIVGYARFMRAYSYYHMLMNYGPVILVGDDPMLNNEDQSYYDNYRATYDECVDYICQELEAAAILMPKTVPLSQFGRPTRGAAYGLVARLRLQQASPAFNGGDIARKYFGDWQRSTDGKHYISQTYDETKWAVAAAAAKRVIDMGIYDLHIVYAESDTPELPVGVPTDVYPNGPGGIDPFRSYSYMFNGESVPQQNREYVWGRISEQVRYNTRQSFPGTRLDGWNGMCVPQKIVDAYRTADGKDKAPEDEAGYYNGGGKVFSGYTLVNGISNMYANREMRFYASIGFSRRYWECSSTEEEMWKKQIITYHLGGNADRNDRGNNSIDYNLTGYVITKFIHPEDAYKGQGARVLDKAYGIIRYAEILLSYVEAMNNLTTTHVVPMLDEFGEKVDYTVSRDDVQMSYNFNLVRFRAGLPGITSLELEKPQTVQKLLERERMVEFLFENRRYFDVRRWGIYEVVDAEPFVGMDIMSSESGYYTRTVVNHARTRERVVDRRLFFVPLPNHEIRKMTKLDQNPGWTK